MIQLILLWGLFFGADKPSNNDIPGTYVRRIQRNSDVRQFSRTLTLNCDLTVIATFQGDMMNEKVKGHWKINGDTLKVMIDEPLGHWNKQNLFLVHKKRLINVVTEINGKEILDRRLRIALGKESKRYAYDKTKKQICE